MALTKSEKLLKKDGKKVCCEICNRMGVFSSLTWRMSGKKVVVCPGCYDKVIASGGLLISI